MTFDVFNDVFSLNLTLEPAQGVLYRFALLQFYFCQLKIHPQTHRKFTEAFKAQVLISYVPARWKRSTLSVVSAGV